MPSYILYPTWLKSLTFVALTPDLISTSLTHVAHILVLASRYLALHLPAEITLPRRDYPRPTIFALDSSYQHGDLPFPGSGANITFGSHNRTRDASSDVPRPRPLFIDKPLALLAKEDQSSYKYFLEGVTLLAYDIAWACSTQGVSVGEKNGLDEICNIGRNLYNLLAGAQSLENPLKSNASKNQHDTESNPNQQGPVAPALSMGRYSHGSTFAYLGNAEGIELIRNFKLPSPLKLADDLKQRLLSEMGNPDWEVVEDEAWAPEDAMASAIIIPNDQRETGYGTSTEVPQDKQPAPSTRKSGWTMVKQRGGRSGEETI